MLTSEDIKLIKNVIDDILTIRSENNDKHITEKLDKVDNSLNLLLSYIKGTREIHRLNSSLTRDQIKDIEERLSKIESKLE